MTISIEKNTWDLSDTNRKYGTYLAFAYLFFYYVRPQAHIPGLNVIPISGVLVWMFTIWGVFHIRTKVFKTPLILIFLLGISFSLSSIDAFNIASHRLAIKTFTQIFPQCVALYIIFDSLPRIQNMFKLWCVIYFLMALITIKNGGTGPGDFSWDNNDAALALGMGLPIMFYTILSPGLTKKQKILASCAAIVLVAGIVITNSRGGFLGLIGGGLILWWFSKNRLKVAVLGLIFSIALSGIALSFLPDGYLDEMRSINDAEDSTRVERLRLWETAWEMYKDNPVVGVGPYNQLYNMMEYQRKTSWYTGLGRNYQGKVVHSLYFQILSEVGTIGGILYFYILFIMPLKLYRLQSVSKGNGETAIYIRLISRALIASMGVYIVSGAFISVAYYPHVFIWVAMYSILMRLSENASGESMGTTESEFKVFQTSESFNEKS